MDNRSDLSEGSSTPEQEVRDVGNKADRLFRAIKMGGVERARKAAEGVRGVTSTGARVTRGGLDNGLTGIRRAAEAVSTASQSAAEVAGQGVERARDSISSAGETLSVRAGKVKEGVSSAAQAAGEIAARVKEDEEVQEAGKALGHHGTRLAIKAAVIAVETVGLPAGKFTRLPGAERLIHRVPQVIKVAERLLEGGEADEAQGTDEGKGGGKSESRAALAAKIAFDLALPSQISAAKGAFEAREHVGPVVEALGTVIGSARRELGEYKQRRKQIDEAMGVFDEPPPNIGE